MLRSWLFPAVVILMCLTTPLFAQDTDSSAPVMISDVHVVGNSAIDTQTILSMIKTAAGKPLSAIQIREDIKDLYGKGFFDEISVETRQEEKGVVVIFLVKEKPIVTKLEIVGNKKISTDTLTKELTVQLKKIYDPAQVKKDEEKLKAKYLEKGFTEIEIRSEAINTSSNNVSVIYKVLEGTKIRIQSITFAGNKSFSDKKLRKVLKKTRKHWMFSG
jgi:outer membrane protein insertion porin family